jgi:hypothetical protein
MTTEATVSDSDQGYSGKVSEISAGNYPETYLERCAENCTESNAEIRAKRSPAPTARIMAAGIAAVTATAEGVVEQDTLPACAPGVGRISHVADRGELPIESGDRALPAMPGIGSPDGTRRWHTSHTGSRHPPRTINEALDVLSEEGYLVAKITGPASPLHVMGWGKNGTILVRIARTREAAGHARDAAALYEEEIRSLQPYCRAPAADVQLWVFSHRTGLTRFQVFDWGIWNLSAMQEYAGKLNVAVPGDRKAR